MISVIMIKQIVNGPMAGVTFNDKLNVKDIKDLDILNYVGVELPESVSNHKIISASIWDNHSMDYMTRKQAEFKLLGY